MAWCTIHQVMSARSAPTSSIDILGPIISKGMLTLIHISCTASFYHLIFDVSANLKFPPIDTFGSTMSTKTETILSFGTSWHNDPREAIGVEEDE